MRVCIIKATGKLFEAQSHARPGTLIANAVTAGFAPEAVEEREATDAEYQALLVSARVPLSDAQKDAAVDADKALRAVAAWFLDKINEGRARHSLAPIPPAQALTEIKALYRALA
jgi:hypothetical protein